MLDKSSLHATSERILMGFPGLPKVAPNCSGICRTMNVCVVTSEFLGPVKNGGMGTATSGLVRQLVADSHKVTLLYTFVSNGRPFTGDKPWQYWVDELAAQ